MKYCCNTHRISHILLLIIFTLITGCGQKGPLEYTPAQQERVDSRNQEREAKRLAAEREKAEQEMDNEQDPDNAQASDARQEDSEDAIQQR